jgi:hypothetical protein
LFLKMNAFTIVIAIKNIQVCLNKNSIFFSLQERQVDKMKFKLFTIYSQRITNI